MAYRSRERVRKVLAHQEADRVPYHAMRNAQVGELVETMNLLADGSSADHRAFCLEGDFAALRLEPEPEIERFRSYLGDLSTGTEVSCWGIGQQAQTTQAGWHAGHRMFHPLANVDTLQGLASYPFPDLAASGVDAGLEEKVRRLQAKGYTVLGQMSQTILETAYNLRGIPQLMLDFYERPLYVEALFCRIAQQRLFQARRFAEAGVDVLRIGDDIATQRGLMVSPAFYRERIKPLHAAVIGEARRVKPEILVKYHSDGQLTDLLPELIDVGVNIINPVQPECMDLVEIKRTYGDQLVLWGCMPVQSLYAHGSAEDVRRHLEFLMQEIAVGGGMVANFINFLWTDRSRENLRTFFEVFYELGRYA
jgi:uroporphyrinogen decarboxylase